MDATQTQSTVLHHSRRDFLRLSGIALGALALAACAPVTAPGAKPSGGGAAAPAGEKVTLRLQNWFTEQDMKSWQIGLDKVKEAYPNIETKLEYNDYDQTAVRILALAASGDLPDLIMASNEHTPILACSELLLDLNPFIEREPDVKPDDFAAGVSQGFHMWGRWWGFPYDHSTWGVFYNKKMFDDAGVPYPPSEGKTPWTVEQFVEAAKKLTKPDGKQWGALYPQNQYLDSCFIYSAGGRNFDDDLRHCTIDSPATATGLQVITDFVHKHKIAPPPAELKGATVDYFASGLVAMQIDGQWALQGKNATVNFPFDIAYLPIIKDKRGVTGGSGFCISASSKHAEDAWHWLKIYTSGDVLAEMVGRPGRGIPARWSATPAYLQAGGKAAHPSVFIEQLQWAFNDRSVVAFYEFIDSYNRNLAPAFETGQGDIAAALAAIQKETNTAMDEKWATCKLKM
ncbi:MAG: sugar ABC transporter substrate-binding protein [Caldilineaceae bacterium]